MGDGGAGEWQDGSAGRADADGATAPNIWLARLIDPRLTLAVLLNALALGAATMEPAAAATLGLISLVLVWDLRRSERGEASFFPPMGGEALAGFTAWLARTRHPLPREVNDRASAAVMGLSITAAFCLVAAIAMEPLAIAFAVLATGIAHTCFGAAMRNASGTASTRGTKASEDAGSKIAAE